VRQARLRGHGRETPSPAGLATTKQPRCCPAHAQRATPATVVPAFGAPTYFDHTFWHHDARRALWLTTHAPATYCYCARRIELLVAPGAAPQPGRAGCGVHRGCAPRVHRGAPPRGGAARGGPCAAWWAGPCGLYSRSEPGVCMEVVRGRYAAILRCPGGAMLALLQRRFGPTREACHLVRTSILEHSRSTHAGWQQGGCSLAVIGLRIVPRRAAYSAAYY